MIYKINEIDIESEFERLANTILLEKELVVNDASFNFTEIEFYFYSENHQDAFTHTHGEDAGKWRFHNQGFDFTLKGDSGFGGILIRGVQIKNGQNDSFINGPRRVLFSIMKHLNNVNNPKNVFGIIDKQIDKLNIFKTFRKGLNNPISHLKSDNLDYFRTAKYRYIVNPQSFDKKQFSESEKIAKSFNNPNLSFEFLGYNLKQ